MPSTFNIGVVNNVIWVQQLLQLDGLDYERGVSPQIRLLMRGTAGAVSTAHRSRFAGRRDEQSGAGLLPADE